MTGLTNITYFNIPYWPNRRLNVNVNRVARRNGKITIMLTLLFRDKNMPGA